MRPTFGNARGGILRIDQSVTIIQLVNRFTYLEAVKEVSPAGPKWLVSMGKRRCKSAA
jgi:hypothetical protein